MSGPAYSSTGTIKPNLHHGTLQLLEAKMEKKERKRSKYDTLG